MSRVQKQFSFRSEEQFKLFKRLAAQLNLDGVSALAQGLADGTLYPFPVEICELLDRMKTQLGLTHLQELVELSQSIRVQVPQIPSGLERFNAFIKAQQNFVLSYESPVGNVLEHRVEYASLHCNSHGWQLACYCHEPSPSAEIPQLAHNYFFQLNALEQANLLPHDGNWRVQGLDAVCVELSMFGDWVYRPIPDCQDEFHVHQIAVVDGRSCRATSWLVSDWSEAKRYILSAGSLCRVVSPDVAKQSVVIALQQNLKDYT